MRGRAPPSAALNDDDRGDEQMNILSRLKVMGAASWRRPGASGPLQGPPFRERRGHDVEPVPIKRLAAVPVAFTLVLGGASLAAVPAANAADGAMISVTLDDAWASQFTNALPILNKYGVPATMYVHSDAVNAPGNMSQAEIQAFADRGDEIASHTVSHTDLTTLTPAQLDTELAQSKAALKEMFGPNAAVDFASPFGAHNPTTTAAVKKYYASQRNTDEGYNSPSAPDTDNILVQNVVETTTALDVQGWINTAKNSNTWLVLVYHEVGAKLGGDAYNTDTAVFDAHMAAVKNSGLPMVTVRQALSGSTPPPPVTKYPLYKIVYDSTIFEMVPDSSGTEIPRPLSYEKWRDVYNFQTPAAASTDFVKYPWSPTIYAVTFWPGGENNWMWTQLSLVQWQTAGRPTPRNAGWIKGSYYYKWGSSNELFVEGADGVNHKLTGAEWAASGYRSFVDRSNEGYLRLTWAPEIARMSSLSAGAGRPMGYNEWQEEAFPTPQAVQRITGDSFYKNSGSSTIWYKGPAMERPVTYSEWTAAGSPSPSIR